MGKKNYERKEIFNLMETHYIISGLTPFVGYVVKMAARNVNGSGIFVEATQVIRDDGKYTNFCKFIVASGYRHRIL